MPICWASCPEIGRNRACSQRGDFPILPFSAAYAAEDGGPSWPARETPIHRRFPRAPLRWPGDAPGEQPADLQVMFGRGALRVSSPIPRSIPSVLSGRLSDRKPGSGFCAAAPSVTISRNAAPLFASATSRGTGTTLWVFEWSGPHTCDACALWISGSLDLWLSERGAPRCPGAMARPPSGRSADCASGRPARHREFGRTRRPGMFGTKGARMGSKRAWSRRTELAGPDPRHRGGRLRRWQ